MLEPGKCNREILKMVRNVFFLIYLGNGLMINDLFISTMIELRKRLSSRCPSQLSELMRKKASCEALVTGDSVSSNFLTRLL